MRTHPLFFPPTRALPTMDALPSRKVRRILQEALMWPTASRGLGVVFTKCYTHLIQHEQSAAAALDPKPEEGHLETGS